MYWRVRSVTPEQLMRQYGVHIALAFSMLLNLVLFLTAPKKTVDQTIKSDFEQFARKVTQHLLDSSYISYEQSTAALFGGELAPSVINQMKQTDKLPKSIDDVKATSRTLTQQRQVSAVRIDQVNQGEPTGQGLIPIDVTGVVAIHSAEESGPSGPVPFHFRYLMGQNAQTQKPIVATFSE